MSLARAGFTAPSVGAKGLSSMSPPITLRHGVDLVHNPRIAHLLHRHGDRFIERCFTERERGWSIEGLDPALLRVLLTDAEPPEDLSLRDSRRLQRAVERFAARFAAKEAALKAIGTGWRDGIAWTDVEVTRQPSGEPGLRLDGQAEVIARSLGTDAWSVSLSHAGAYSIASVIGWRAC